MRRMSVWMVVVLLVVVGAAAGCEVSASTANISDAWMSADEAGEERTTVYAADQDFYAQVSLANAPGGTVVKTAWIAVDVENTEPDYLIDEVETEAESGTIFFTLTNDSLWPTGMYKVDLYLNDELDRSLEFEVQ